MFLRLVNKEIKYQLKSITFGIFCVSVVLFYITQFVGDINMEDMYSKSPTDILAEGSIFYASDREDELNICFTQKLDMLHSLLDNDEKNNNFAVLSNLAVVERKDLNDEQLKLISTVKKELEEKDISEQEYQDILQQLNNELSHINMYKDDKIKNLVAKKILFEETIRRKEEIATEEKVTGSYARLFADYIGIAVGFFAVFIAAFTLIRDRKYKSYEIIYTKKISSIKYVLSKYIGNVFLMLIVVLVLAGYSTIYFANHYGNIDYFAFIKISITWILPTIMIVTSLAYLLQIVSGNGILPIIVQFVYWNYSMPFSNSQYNVSKYIIRYNHVSTLSEYQKVANDIMINRIVTVAVSVVILIGAIWIFERKRGNICGKN
ncbi:ABC transporter permease [Vallitalea sediminicola]